MKERKDIKSTIESVREFDFFNEFSIDNDLVELFRYKFDINFKSRKQPSIFYRNIFIIGMIKSNYTYESIALLIKSDHSTITNIVSRTVGLVENRDSVIIDILESVKFFFERYALLRRHKLIDGRSGNEFLSSLELERRVFFTGLVKPNN